MSQANHAQEGSDHSRVMAALVRSMDESRKSMSAKYPKGRPLQLNFREHSSPCGNFLKNIINVTFNTRFNVLK